MYPSLKDLFLRCFKRRVRIRKMALRAEGLVPPTEQLSLFGSDMPELQKHVRMHRLSRALDCVRERFGDRAVSWGGSQSSRPSIRPSRGGARERGRFQR